MVPSPFLKVYLSKVYFQTCIFQQQDVPGFSSDKDCSLSRLVCRPLQCRAVQQRWLYKKPCGGGLHQITRLFSKVPVCTFVSNALKAFPLDAGTDNGFTFTSPNWETEPRGEVFQITNRFFLLKTNLIHDFDGLRYQPTINLWPDFQTIQPALSTPHLT